jgi:hypothetical protein
MPKDEQQKLTAAWLNILAAGTVSTGGVVQIAAVLSGERVGSAAVHSAITAVVCLASGLMLHLLARWLVSPASGSGSDAPRASGRTDRIEAALARPEPEELGVATAA